MIRVVSIYLPNGNPIGTEKFTYKLAWMARFKAPTPANCWRRRCRSCWPATTTSFPIRSTAKRPRPGSTTRCFSPRRAMRYHALLGPWPHRRDPHLPSRARRLHVLGLPGRRVPEERRHPHRSHPALAAVRRHADKFRHRHIHARLGKALRPRARVGRTRRVISKSCPTSPSSRCVPPT